jgi:hypothetical protein
MFFVIDCLMTFFLSEWAILITCVHYNYKWVTNLVVDFQISSNVLSTLKKIYCHTKQLMQWPNLMVKGLVR